MFIHIALKDLKIIFRDRKALAIMLAMPAILILIIGTALSSAFSGNAPVKQFSICVVDNDRGFMSKVLIEEVLKKNLSGIFETLVVDEEKANEMLKKKDVPSAIIIPEGFSANIDANKPVTIEVRSHKEGGLKASIVNGVVDVFARNISFGYAGAFAAVDVLDKSGIPLSAEGRGMSAAAAIMADLQGKLSSEILQFVEVDQEKSKSVTSMQYYAAAMLVMFLLFGANMGSKLMVEERESRTLGRILTAKTNRLSLVAGKFTGLFCICCLQSAILIMFTAVLYRVDWGGSIAAILIVTVCAVLAASGFGLLVAAIAKTAAAANGMGTFFIQLSTFIGGGMFPIFFMPDAIKFLAKFTINWWAFKGYMDIMMGAGVFQVLPYCGILAAIAAGCVMAGALRLRV